MDFKQDQLDLETVRLGDGLQESASVKIHLVCAPATIADKELSAMSAGRPLAGDEGVEAGHTVDETERFQEIESAVNRRRLGGPRRRPKRRDQVIGLHGPTRFGQQLVGAATGRRPPLAGPQTGGLRLGEGNGDGVFGANRRTDVTTG
jgi:hypothetical protein